MGKAWWAIAAALAAAIAVAAAAPAARADGDPASDYLLVQNVFVPYESPAAAGVSADLERAVSAVYLHGDRVKVAAIFTKDDLGSVPSLFGHPAEYAQFLGIEIGFWYAGPLLVVMPGGFGVYDGGRSTAAEQQVLRSLSVAAGSSDDLVRSATAAVQRMAAAGALSSPDLKAPLVTAYPATAKRGRTATLHFDLFDDSGRTSALVRIYEKGTLLATLGSPMALGVGTRSAAVRWPVPKQLAGRELRFCVVASDPSGNRSKPTCAPFLRVS
jgi:hypothetical protein